jgi:DinB superfamily
VKKLFIFLLIGSGSIFHSYSQDVKLWTETDRKYLLDNIVRGKEELIKETKGLTKEQWSFKESRDRWSINQVVEHIATWELLLDHEISRALTEGLKPELYKTANPDSVILGFIMEEKPHISIEYTRPFTYTVPMGLNDLQNNMAWLLKLRNESIDYLEKAKEDLRSYNLKPGSPDIHQRYITLFGHGDRHLRQIRKIKQHPNYPK